MVGNKYQPYEEFKWLKMLMGLMWYQLVKKSLIGYFLEVDLKYPDELHELHNDYPLAREKLAVSSDMLHYIFNGHQVFLNVQ